MAKIKEKGESGYHVLMADGYIEDHDLVKRAARECGVNHIFTSVYNGNQLMQFLTKRGAYSTSMEGLPDLLIMDIRLDIIDGFKILNYIKEQNLKFPIYVLTKTKVEEDVLKAKKLGVKEFFQKPLKYEDWRGIVGGICEENFNSKLRQKH